MRKTILLIMLVCLALSGCRNIPYEEGSTDRYNWEEQPFTVAMDCVPDQETAVDIADRLLKQLKKERVTGFVRLVEVYLDTDDNLWFVSYAGRERVPGATITFVIRKDTGEVAKIFVLE